MNKILQEIKKRITSPVFWVGVASIVTLIFTTAGIEFENITSWKMLLDNIVMIIKNPYLVVSILIAIFSFLNNPTTKDKF